MMALAPIADVAVPMVAATSNEGEAGNFAALLAGLTAPHVPAQTALVFAEPTLISQASVDVGSPNPCDLNAVLAIAEGVAAPMSVAVATPDATSLTAAIFSAPQTLPQASPRTLAIAEPPSPTDRPASLDTIVAPLPVASAISEATQLPGALLVVLDAPPASLAVPSASVEPKAHVAPSPLTTPLTVAVAVAEAAPLPIAVFVPVDSVKVDADADPKPVRTLDRAAASKTIVEATLPSPVVSSPVAQSSPETRAESVPALADAAVRLLVPAPSVLERTPAFDTPTRATIFEAASMPTVATFLARQAFGSPAIDFALASVEQHVRTSGMAVLKLEALAIGPVAVEVAQHADGVSLNFATATPEARLALTDAQPRLIAEARAAGIALLDTGVDQGARDRRPHRTGQRATPHRFIDATTRSSADRFA